MVGNGRWQQFKLEEVCDQITDGKHGDCQNEAGSGYYFLSAKSVKDGRLLYETGREITKEDFEETHKRTRLEPGDILFTNSGTIGRMAIAPDDELTSRTTFQKSVALLKPTRSIIEPLFLYYLLRYDNKRLSEFAHGTTQKNLLLKDFRVFPIEVLPLPEQKAIAHILGTLDDKIDLNRRMNETLEATARAIFKSWFVDFDPVRAKLDGQKPVGMDDETAKLFPDRFEDSELGSVPNGWEVVPLSKLAELQTVSVQPGNESTKCWEHYSIPAFDGGKRPALELGATIKSGKYRVPANAVLVSKLNPRFPRVWLPDVDNAGAAICSTEFMPFVPRLPKWRPYLFELAKSENFQGEILSRVTGSTGSRQRVKPTEIAVVPVLAPPVEAIDEFSLAVAPLHEKQLANVQESTTLAALRDTLLPKLLSGEISVTDCEAALPFVP